MRASPHELEELLAHGPWVRALARSLVRDPARAEDLVQQAWVRALERPPGQQGSLRRWFAAVLRNLARQEHRSAVRRAAREQFAGARGPGAPADELNATLELSQLLAKAVAALEEPYRSAIFRRYYEGLAPRHIAELEGVPLKTLKTRLARGLEKLRERLDREHEGDRGAWVAACLPLVRMPKSALLLGGIVMNIKLACVAAGILLVGAWAVLHGRGAGLPDLPDGAGGRGAPLAAALDAGMDPPAGARSDARETRGRASISRGASSTRTDCRSRACASTSSRRNRRSSRASPARAAPPASRWPAATRAGASRSSRASHRTCCWANARVS